MELCGRGLLLFFFLFGTRATGARRLPWLPTPRSDDADDAIYRSGGSFGGRPASWRCGRTVGEPDQKKQKQKKGGRRGSGRARPIKTASSRGADELRAAPATAMTDAFRLAGARPNRIAIDLRQPEGKKATAVPPPPQKKKKPQKKRRRSVRRDGVFCRRRRAPRRRWSGGGVTS